MKPLLAVYWTQLLIIVDNPESSWLEEIIFEASSKGRVTQSHDIALRGVFLLACERLASVRGGDCEHVYATVVGKPQRWFALLLTNIKETPVQDLIYSITSRDNMDEFLKMLGQAMRNDQFVSAPPSFQCSVLQVLRPLPPSQALLTLLINEVLPTSRLVTRRLCDTFSGRVLDALLKTMVGDDGALLLPGGTSPAWLLSLFAQYRSVCRAGDSFKMLDEASVTLEEAFRRAKCHTPQQSSTIEQLMAVPPEKWLLQFVEGMCARSARSGRSNFAIRALLERLDIESVRQVIFSDEFDPMLLGVCLGVENQHATADAGPGEGESRVRYSHGAFGEEWVFVDPENLQTSWLSQLCEELVCERVGMLSAFNVRGAHAYGTFVNLVLMCAIFCNLA